jgi:hypothetical protein
MNVNNLKMTADEERLLCWCYANLEDEQRADCEEEAFEIAAREINAGEAADLLVRLYAKIIVRNVRAQLDGGAD